MSHARLSPSASSRWMNCPGSANYNMLYNDVSSPAAIDGTGSHLLLELCVLQGRRPESFLGEIIGVNHHDKPNGWLVRKDRADRVQVAIDYIKGKNVEAESRSDIGIHFGRDDLAGTCDLFDTVMSGDYIQHAEAIDYKDGQGFVSETRNSQLIIYLAGKVWGKKIAKDAMFAITIIQPKTKPMIRTYALTYDMLKSEVEAIIKAAEATDDFDAPLVRGDWCKWCLHKPYYEAEVGLSFLNKAVDKMTAEELEDALNQEKQILDKYKLIKEEAQRRVHELRGYSMRPGKGSNELIGTPKEIEAAFKHVGLSATKLYDKKLKSYAALKKLKLTEEQMDTLEQLNKYEAGKLTLTKIKPKSIKEMFGEEI